MKREFDFSEEFGKINEKLVEEAGKEWEVKKRQILQLYSRKIASAAAIVLLCVIVANGSRVQASVKEIVTKIGQMWQVQEDLSPYTEIINKELEKEGFAVTLNEVIVSDHQIYASVTVNSDYPEGQFAAKEFVTINGQDCALLSIGDETPEYNGEREDFKPNPNHLFVMELRDMPETITDIQLHFLAYKNAENFLKGENAIAFDFGFTITKEELAWDTMEIQYDKTFPLTDGMEIKIKELVITPVTSRLEVKILNVPKENAFDGYYLEGADSLGNPVSYYSTSVKGKDGVIFTSELQAGGLPSLESDWMELRLYTYQQAAEGEQEAVEVVDGEEIMIEDDGQPMNLVYLGDKFKVRWNGGEAEDYSDEPFDFEADENTVWKNEISVQEVKDMAAKGEDITEMDFMDYYVSDSWWEEEKEAYIDEYAVENGCSIWIIDKMEADNPKDIYLVRKGEDGILDLRHTTPEEVYKFFADLPDH